MGKNKGGMSPVKRGMNRNTAPYLLEGMEYLFALNTNIQDDESTIINLTNEESNVLATKFTDGFIVIGKKNDINSKGTYFFLANPDTGKSEWGIIKNNQVERTDILDDLTVPLEEVEQTPYQEYTTLIDKGLDLDVNHPIKKIVIKHEQCGVVIAFTDNWNAPRLIVVDKLEDYLIKDKEVDPDKIAIFKKSLLPEIDVNPLVTGGRLRRGTYQFLVAYTNSLGEEISEYTSATNPIAVFDKNDRVLESSEIADRTNFAIKLTLNRLDETKEYYKVVVIQNTDIEGGVRFYEEGMHPISDKTINYSTEENKVGTSLERINRTLPYVKKWKGLTETKGHLVGYGITEAKEVNLQPVVNLMGSFLKWQTSIADESLYERGDAVAKYKGYMRNETYPISVRVKFTDGYTTALFPLVARPADSFKFSKEYQDDKVYNELDNVPDSKDSQSIQSKNTALTPNERTKIWQYYNTATKEGQRKTKVDYKVIQEQNTKESIMSEVAEIPAMKFSIDIDSEFNGLEEYLEINGKDCSVVNHPELCDFLDVKNYPQHKVPTFTNCDVPALVADSENIVVNTITGEVVELIDKEIEKYPKVTLKSSGNLFLQEMVDDKYEYVKRVDFENDKTAQVVWSIYPFKYAFVKLNEHSNTTCYNSIDLQTISTQIGSASGNVTSNAFSNPLFGRDSQSEVVTEFNARPNTSESVDRKTAKYYNKVHQNALWFKGKFEKDEDTVLLELTKSKNLRDGEAGAASKTLRVSIFDSCNNYEYIISRKIDTSQGVIIDLVKSELGITGNEFVVAIDTPSVEDDGKFLNSSFDGEYSIHLRKVEYSSANISFDKITLDKTELYEATCNFEIPQVGKFGVAPFEYGKFSYVESTENYPDNRELYDSSTLKIDLKKIPDSIKGDFKKYFIKDNPDGTYKLNENSDLTDKPIRHFKFPDNDLSPFISNVRQASFSDSVIYPIGVHIDDEVVSAFLDVALDNGLLTQEQRDSVLAFEIFRGDRTLDKSIEAKGLLYDNYQVKEESEQVYFSNFPFNTLGDNPLMYENKDSDKVIKHPYDSKGNNSFSFISPDNQFRKLSDPTELQVEGYQFGNSKSYITDVEDHPKWVILGDKAYRLANTLAIAETVAEIAIQIAQAIIDSAETWRVDGGFVFSANPVGIGLGIAGIGIITGFSILSSSIFSVARYRNEWLTTFRDLGQPENFAAYSTGVGEYNSLRSIPSIGNNLRRIDTIKDVKSGRFSFRHNDNGERIVLNNQDRESSTYIYLGEDFNLDYPKEYQDYDNQNSNFNYASRTTATQEGVCTVGQSGEILSNVASPYVSLKNYIPSQYGSVDSIKWLPTSYISYFENKQDTIFGGDIFISRMAMKRKMPLFIRDAMKIASLIPFNYSFYDNIGKNKYYCNYEVTEEVNLETTLFPDFQSEFNFDCLSGNRDFYVKPPSKFYLYYYGVVNFLVESEINSNFRYGKKESRANFYPNIGDIVDWTQETKVSIKEPNRFFYNGAYSLSTTPVTTRTLPFTYSKKEYDCRYDSPNGAMWSLPDNSEKSLSEPWLVFRPYDRHIFPASYGSLTDLKGIENERILGRFTNQTAIFNAVDMTIDGITSQSGDGNLFSQRTATFSETDLGYLGSKTAEVISCEYGHFFPDTERGQVFMIQPSGQGMEEISKYTGGKPNGMDKWFKNHLPFKVLSPLVNNYDKIDVDNSYKGIGITMGWDSKSKRVFMTKKDYIPLKEMNYENGHFFAAKDEMELITDYESDGYTYLGKEGYYYKFNKATVVIPPTTDIFVTINVNDYTLNEALEIKAEVTQWASEIPDFSGEVIVVSTDSNRWLSMASQFNSSSNIVYNQGVWNSFSNYTGQTISTEALVINFTNTSAYIGTEPTNEFINDYKSFMDSFSKIDYLKTIVISKDEVIEGHISDILKNEGVYRDKAIQGTTPQKFLEALSIYGVSHITNFDMDTEQALNEELGDEFINGTILVKGDIINVTDTEFFKDVSWTIAYQTESGSWLSYYSFKPNYYVGHNTYLQSGVNNQEDKEGLWSHNMSNKSYGVFYGEKFPWTVEYPIKNEYVTKRLQNITLNTEAKRYIGQYDFAYDKNITFDHAVIYNSYENSGLLNLIPQKSLSQVNKYPKKKGNSQDILISYQDFNWTFNNIYNRTLSQDGNIAPWISDENQIDKTINHNVVQFGGKKVLSYLRGDYFIVRLTQDNSTQHSIMFKWATNQEEVY